MTLEQRVTQHLGSDRLQILQLMTELEVAKKRIAELEAAQAAKPVE